MSFKESFTPSSLGGLFIGLGLIVSAVLITSVLGDFVDQRRFVSVKGLSERELPADRVVWPILYKEVGNDLLQLSRAIESKTAIITQYLEDNGIESSEIAASAPEIIDMQAERYVAQQTPFRYNITSVITVTTNKVAKVRELLSRQAELLKQGVAISGGDYRYNVLYQYTKLNEIKVGMIEEASANARASAEQFAADSKSKLGKIKEASQGQISITDRDPNTPHVKQIRVVTSVSYFLKD